MIEQRATMKTEESDFDFGVMSRLFPTDASAYRGDHHQPESAERMLLWAVLKDACETYLKFKIDTLAWREAHAWLVGKLGEDEIFSYESVCEYLHLDPSYFRKRILAEAGSHEMRRIRHRHHCVMGKHNWVCTIEQCSMKNRNKPCSFHEARRDRAIPKASRARARNGKTCRHYRNRRREMFPARQCVKGVTCLCCAVCAC